MSVYFWETVPFGLIHLDGHESSIKSVISENVTYKPRNPETVVGRAR